MKYLLLLLFALSANATVYYVRTDGNDANGGTVNSAGGAWRTVGKAATTIVGGDTVNIQAGDYTSESVLTIGTSDGSAGNYRKFVGVGNTTIMPLLKIAKQYVWIQDCKIFSTSLPADHSQFNGVDMIAGASHDVVTNVFIQCKGYGIHTAFTDYTIDDIRIDHCFITNCQSGMWIWGKAGGTGWRIYTNTIVKLKEWILADTDAFRVTSGGNHMIMGNLGYGNTTNDIFEVVNNHYDYLQTWDEAANTPSVTNLIIAWNMWLDLGGIQGTDFSPGVGHGGWIITNNVIGRGLWNKTGSTVLPMGTGPVNFSNMSNVNSAPLIVKNNTFLLTSRPNILEDCTIFAAFYTNNIFMTNGSASQGWTYKFNSAPGSGNYNSAYPTAAPVPGAQDVLQDPLFVNINDPIGPDGIPFTADDGLRLAEFSPALTNGVGGTYQGAYANVPFIPLVTNVTVRLSGLLRMQ